MIVLSFSSARISVSDWSLAFNKDIKLSLLIGILIRLKRKSQSYKKCSISWFPVINILFLQVYYLFTFFVVVLSEFFQRQYFFPGDFQILSNSSTFPGPGKLISYFPGFPGHVGTPIICKAPRLFYLLVL